MKLFSEDLSDMEMDAEISYYTFASLMVLMIVAMAMIVKVYRNRKGENQQVMDENN